MAEAEPGADWLTEPKGTTLLGRPRMGTCAGLPPNTPGQLVLGEWFVQAEVPPGTTSEQVEEIEARLTALLAQAFGSLRDDGMTFVISTSRDLPPY